MRHFWPLLPVKVLWLVTCVHSQDVCTQASTIISSQNDLQALSLCTTINGDLVVADSFSGPLVFEGIKEITGSIICSGAANLTSIASNDLVLIEQTLEVHDLPSLTILSFPTLQRVQNVSIINVPFLWNIETNPAIDLTNFQLSGSNQTDFVFYGGANATTLSVTLTNNRQLALFGILNTTTMNALTVAGNGDDFECVMPALQTVSDLTVWNASKLALPVLKNVAGSLTMAGNNFTFINMSAVVQVRDGIFIVENPRLHSLALPLLQTMGGLFQVADNPQLQSISIPSLVQGEYFDFTGNFSSVNVPSNATITGSVHIQSSNESLNCTSMNHTIISTDWIECDTVPNPQPEVAINSSVVYPLVSSGVPSSLSSSPSSFQSPNPTSLPTSTNRSSPSTPLTTPTKIGIGIGVGLGTCLLVLVIAIATLRSKRTQPNEPHYPSSPPIHGRALPELSNHMNYAQLHSSPLICELSTDIHYLQLEAVELTHELSTKPCKDLPDLPRVANSRLT